MREMQGRKCWGNFSLSVILRHSNVCSSLSTVLSDLGDELHRARDAWNIGKTCPCKSYVGSESAAKISELPAELGTTGAKEAQQEPNDNCAGKTEKEDTNVTAVKKEAASSSSNQIPGALDSESSFDGSDDVNLICDESLGVESPADHEQEWLTEEKRRNHFTKKAGFGLVEAKPRRDKGSSAGLSLLMDYTSSTEASPCESPANTEIKSRSGAFNFSFSSGLDLLVLACEEKEGLPMPCTQALDQGSKNPTERSKSRPQVEQNHKEVKDGNCFCLFSFIFTLSCLRQIPRLFIPNR